jgi:hypothetical protein
LPVIQAQRAGERTVHNFDAGAAMDRASSREGDVASQKLRASATGKLTATRWSPLIEKIDWGA